MMCNKILGKVNKFGEKRAKKSRSGEQIYGMGGGGGGGGGHTGFIVLINRPIVPLRIYSSGSCFVLGLVQFVHRSFLH